MSTLADKIHSLIATEEVSVKEAIVALVDTQYRLIHGEAGKIMQEAVEAVEPVITPQKPKKIQYDSMYDPPPPMEVDRVPERVESPNRVLARANTACICNGCKKVVYTTNKDVIDGMKVADFIDAYTPTPGMPKISRTAEIQNIENNIATDCPACNASKQLYLTGGPHV